GLVYVGLFVIVTCVAVFNFRRSKRMMAGTSTSAVSPSGEQVPGVASVMKVMPFVSFLTLVSVAVVPLAAALYVVTSTTWSAVERAVLYRDVAVPATAAVL
ncbi:hypothetical protein FNH08_47575, partial [Streptomyces spongiae]|nr:hypothetical protein [Streptomyces spongiae]